MELSELYSRGTRLSDVDVCFRGMRLNEWKCRQVQEMAKLPAVAKFWARFEKDPRALAAHDKVTTPRDEYGIRGLRGR